MEQEKKTVNWLLSELESLEHESAELEYALHTLLEKSKRYNVALEALTGMCYDEHVHKDLFKAMEDKEREGA